jgi:hypothetical protein
MTMPRATRTATAVATVDPASATDRRRFPRMRLDHPVTCDLEGETFVVQARSISGDGMLFESETRIAPGTQLTVRVEPPLIHQPFRAEMEVMRVETMADRDGHRFRVAGRFTKVV